MGALKVTLWTALIIFVLDQVTKLIVLVWIDLDVRQVFSVLPPYLTFRMAWNEGINFGLFSGYGEAVRWALVGVAVGISIWILWWMQKEGHSRIVRISAGLVVGGALGNAIDRILYGAVADFLNMSCCGIENPYSFNVADIAIFFGAVGLIFFAGDGSEKSG